MPTVSKAVNAEYGSPGLYGAKGWRVPFTEEEWELLRLDYRLGLTVTPDPAVETAVKVDAADRHVAEHALGSQWYPNGSNGIYASTQFSPEREQTWVPVGGKVIQLEYDEADIVETGPHGYASIQLASAVVVGIWTGTPADVDVATLVELDVATGAAAGAVTYDAVDPDSVSVQSGTATHGTGGHYEFTLAGQPAQTTLTVSWSGTFAAVPRTFTTRVRIR